MIDFVVIINTSRLSRKKGEYNSPIYHWKCKTESDEQSMMRIYSFYSIYEMITVNCTS